MSIAPSGSERQSSLSPWSRILLAFQTTAPESDAAVLSEEKICPSLSKSISFAYRSQ